MFACKINLPYSVSDEMLTHPKSLGPAFESGSFQSSCFPLLWEGLELTSLCTRAEDELSLSTPIPWDPYSGIVLILSELFTVYTFGLTQA